ncbi:alpha/beta fold hydrolase [Cohnella panacarvi]|uniref:alpha/beta fold hydrolase n=1 Tax=Cohnella panacarvi TaxID=400776 RepID=UPI00047C3B06|nr:alpha/beta hydrolase [Cohnella panacarvi]
MPATYKSEEGKQQVLAEYRTILADWPVDNKQYQIPTSYGETFVIESGDPTSPALVLLHGSLSNSFSWYGDVALLSRQFHVFAVDLPGEAGLSSDIRPDYLSGAYEQWLDEVIARLGVKQCSIAGQSLGGWIALRYATVHPDKVGNLALLCPGGLAMQRRNFLFKVLLQTISARGDRSKVIKRVLGMDRGGDGDTNEMRRALDFILLINKYLKPRYATLPVFSDAELSRLTMPILVVFGDNDWLLNANKSIDRIEHNAPNVTTVLLPGVGHAVLGQAERMRDFFVRAMPS